MATSGEVFVIDPMAAVGDPSFYVALWLTAVPESAEEALDVFSAVMRVNRDRVRLWVEVLYELRWDDRTGPFSPLFPEPFHY